MQRQEWHRIGCGFAPNIACKTTVAATRDDLKSLAPHTAARLKRWERKEQDEGGQGTSSGGSNVGNERKVAYGVCSFKTTMMKNNDATGRPLVES